MKRSLQAGVFALVFIALILLNHEWAISQIPCIGCSSGGGGGATGATGPTGATGATGSDTGGILAYTADHTLTSADCGHWLTFSGTNLVLTLASPPPSSTCSFAVQNLDASSATIGRNGLLINTVASNITIAGASGVTATNYACWTDGTNYFCSAGPVGPTGSTGATGVTGSGGAVTPTPPYTVITGTSYGPVFQFTPPNGTGTFNWINQNSSTVTNVNNAFLFNITPSPGTDQLVCYMTDLPAAGADYTADGFAYGISGAWGFALSDGTKIISFYVSGNGQLLKWTNSGAVSGSYFSAANFNSPMFLGVRYQQSGSTRSMFFSADGTNWISPGSGANVTKNDFLTETKFGLCQETNFAFTPKLYWLHSKITQP